MASIRNKIYLEKRSPRIMRTANSLLTSHLLISILLTTILEASPYRLAKRLYLTMLPTLLRSTNKIATIIMGRKQMLI